MRIEQVSSKSGEEAGVVAAPKRLPGSAPDGELDLPEGPGFLARNWGKLTVLALVVLGAGAVLPGIVQGPKVKVVSAARRNLVQRVVATGRVEPPARVNLGTLVAGVAARVGAEEGDRVKAGDLLVELDTTEARALVDQAQAGVAASQARLVQLKATGALVATEGVRQAEISLQNAEAEQQRTESLFKSGAVTKKDLDDAVKKTELARSQRETARLQAASVSPSGGDSLLAQANYSQAQAVLAGAKAKLAQMRIAAPADGVILSRSVEPGELVQPGKALFLLAREGKTRIVAQPDEKSLGLLAVGQKALASVDAFPSQTFEATVGTLAPSVDPQRGTIEVKLDVANPPAYLRADMTVSVDVEVARVDGVVLPTEVIQDAATAKPFVYVVEQGRVARRPVKLGVRGEGSLQILSGVSEGEAVLVQGKPAMVGGRVRVVPREAE